MYKGFNLGRFYEKVVATAKYKTHLMLALSWRIHYSQQQRLLINIFREEVLMNGTQ